jgi:hypothetical protein
LRHISKRFITLDFTLRLWYYYGMDSNGQETGDDGYVVDQTHPPRQFQFTSSFQSPNRGRKPSRLKKFIKDNNVSRDDVNLVIKNVVMNHTKSELDEICRDDDQPMLVRVLVNAFLADFKSGTLYNINSMLDRAYGQADQNINVNDFSNMTHEQKLARLAELQAEREKNEKS